MKRIVATSIIVLSIGAAGTAAVAAGASNGRAMLRPADSPSSGNADTDAAVAGEPGAARRCERGEAQRHRVRRAAVRTAAQAIGITVAELRDGVHEHGSIGAAAEVNGVDASAVEATLLARVQARLDEAIEQGRLDSDRAAAILERAEQRIHRFVTAERGTGTADGADHGNDASG
jgi:hypothetical protein